jgi:hypothetical protein
LILIGQDLDAAAARKALDACLLTDSEMESGPVSWSQLEDPFGCWERQDMTATDHTITIMVEFVGVNPSSFIAVV